MSAPIDEFDSISVEIEQAVAPPHSAGVQSSDSTAKVSIRQGRQLIPRETFPYRQFASEHQDLPFVVRLVQSHTDLIRVCQHRAEAYGRHQPELVKRLKLLAPETDDLRKDAVILIAENKASGSVVGSMRLLTNAQKPLKFEQELPLPNYLQNRLLMEAGRLTASRGLDGQMVVPALVKISYELAYATGIDYSLLIGRAPIDKMYRAMQFSDVFEGKRVVTSAQPGVEVSLFCMPMLEAEQRWLDAQCPLYGFMALTKHADLQISVQEVISRFNGTA